MKKYLGSSITGILLCCVGYSQENPNVIIHSEKPITMGSIAPAKELPKAGTYQIIFKNGVAKREIEQAYLFLIDEKREYDNFVFIDIDSNTQIKIAPFRVINSPTFEPLPTIIYE